MTESRYGAARRNIRSGARDKPYYYRPWMEAQTAKRQRSGKNTLIISILILILAAALIGAVLIGFFSSYFDLKSINVKGLSKHSEEEIILTSGIETGTKLYSIDSDEAERKILAAYPEIADVTVKKVLPADIVIELTYETPEYFVGITGEYFTLSDSLRVIERTSDRKSLESLGLVYVEMPNIKRAVTGERIEFFGGDEVYIEEILKNLSESSFAEEVNRVYIGGKFDIAFVKVGEYRIEMGDFKDQRLKLLMAEKVMESGGYRGVSGVVLDVSDVSESSAMIHKTLKIE
ncbi:MAG: FtsQ-type POTRA domain-containing protein [Clostridia bacterium]|nr:FtsQ-type POTRA domain-containing protein [Clostridia bacterium]